MSRPLKKYRSVRQQLNFDNINVGPTRKSQRTVEPKKSMEDLAKEMLSFLHEHHIPNRCELISPNSQLIRKPGKCVPRNRKVRQCSEKTKYDCKRSQNCSWIREQPSRCDLEGKRRTKAAITVETTCPICQDVILNNENRWGCECGHAMCNKCFQQHVLNTGYKCPVCGQFCDQDGVCRNFNVHPDNEVQGEWQPIKCPFCRTECQKCNALEIRE